MSDNILSREEVKRLLNSGTQADLWLHDAAQRQRIAELEVEIQRLANRQKDGNDWAVATFGEATIESTMRRIDQELREFYEDPVGEAKDIAIFLYRLMSVAGKDLDSEVDAKMAINRARTWVLSGDGCGQHTGSTAKKGLMEEILELRAELATLREEANRLLKELSLQKSMTNAKDVCAGWAGGEVLRLREVIENAPHHPFCKGIPVFGNEEHPIKFPCGCWKSKLADPPCKPAQTVQPKPICICEGGEPHNADCPRYAPPCKTCGGKKQ